VTVAHGNVIAIVTEAFGSPDSVAEMKRLASGDGTDIRLVVPAVEASPFRHTLGDIDGPREDAQHRLEMVLAAMREAEVPVTAELGDPDPVQAAQDALFKGPADEILIFAHADDEQAWYEGDLFKHAEESLEPPLRMIVVDGGPAGDQRIVAVEESGPGLSNPYADQEIDSAYMPGLTRRDLAGMVIGLFGTLVAAVLAAAATAGSAATGWSAVAIGIAVATALVNMAHVVGLTLMESVRYRGGFAKFFRTLALTGTPIAVLANLLILLFA
jgi:hypothetical protein